MVRVMVGWGAVSDGVERGRARLKANWRGGVRNLVFLICEKGVKVAVTIKTVVINYPFTIIP